MKKLIIPFILIASIFASCRHDEPIELDNIVGSWTLQYPDGLHTDGFIEWFFDPNGDLSIRSYDVFAGDYTSIYDYSISEEDKSLTISGDIKNAEGEIIHDKFAIYEIQKLSKKGLSIIQSWVNTKYDDLAPEDKNVFLLGGYKEECFKRSSK